MKSGFESNAFRFPNDEERLADDIAVNNAANSVAAAYETNHPGAEKTIFRQQDTQMTDLHDLLRGADHVENPSEELYWAAREYLERKRREADLPDLNESH